MSHKNWDVHCCVGSVVDGDGGNVGVDNTDNYYKNDLDPTEAERLFGLFSWFALDGLLF